jgi:lysozyme
MTTAKPLVAPGARGRSKTLAGVLGSAAAAAALFTLVPEEESGRKVKAVVQTDGSVSIQHVTGKQYLRAYLDVVGVPTACDGITRNIRMGQSFTEAQCTKLLERDLIEHAEGAVRCVPGMFGRANQSIAGVLLTYNIGIGGFCKSSIARLWNAGQWRAGCDRFLLFNRGGGRVLPGLVKRRQRERAICVTGL